MEGFCLDGYGTHLDSSKSGSQSLVSDILIWHGYTTRWRGMRMSRE